RAALRRGQCRPRHRRQLRLGGVAPRARGLVARRHAPLRHFWRLHRRQGVRGPRHGPGRTRRQHEPDLDRGRQPHDSDTVRRHVHALVLRRRVLRHHRPCHLPHPPHTVPPPPPPTPHSLPP